VYYTFYGPVNNVLICTADVLIASHARITIVGIVINGRALKTKERDRTVCSVQVWQRRLFALFTVVSLVSCRVMLHAAPVAQSTGQQCRYWFAVCLSADACIHTERRQWISRTAICIRHAASPWALCPSVW